MHFSNGVKRGQRLMTVIGLGSAVKRGHNGPPDRPLTPTRFLSLKFPFILFCSWSAFDSFVVRCSGREFLAQFANDSSLAIFETQTLASGAAHALLCILVANSISPSGL